MVKHPDQETTSAVCILLYYSSEVMPKQEYRSQPQSHHVHSHDGKFLSTSEKLKSTERSNYQLTNCSIKLPQGHVHGTFLQLMIDV